MLPFHIGWSHDISWTGYTRVRNLIGLIDVILDVYDNPRYVAHDGETFCNLACQDICHAFKCPDFDNKTADEIFAFLQTSERWANCPIEKVQDLANQGSLVFAVASSHMLSQPHGHIAVIRPGLSVYSGKWGSAPRVMNIGSSNFISRAKSGPLTGAPCGVNESFVPLPKFYALRETL